MATPMEGAFKFVFFLAVVVLFLDVIGFFLLFLKIMLLFFPEIHFFNMIITRDIQV